MQKVSDFIANYLVEQGIQHVFMLTGGGAMHLNDSLAKHPGLEVIFNHHEQACAMAAEAYARLSHKLAVVNVTTGPGGLNTLNGVFGAYTDSIPMLIISGQVRYDTTVRSTGLPLRQMGDQECDIVNAVQQMTKYAVMITSGEEVKYHLQKALYIATQGRPGPVWLDIPMNVQGAQIDPNTLPGYFPQTSIFPTVDYSQLIDRLKSAERPVILAGTGIRHANAYHAFLRCVNHLKIPVVTAFNAHDLLPNDHPYYAGRAGTVGDRAGNFAVQNADVLLILGCRLNIRQIGYNFKAFARAAYKIMVDIDAIEMDKPNLAIQFKIHTDLKTFLPEITARMPTLAVNTWLQWCRERVLRYPVVKPDYWKRENKINPYCFIEVLGKVLDENAIIVTANATACITTFQALTVKKGQRLFSNSGSASMGYDLPAAIGACIAASRKSVVCLAGDGSIQQNIQELATIRKLKLPIKLFVLNNQGYHSIRQTQTNYFSGPLIGVGEDSGLFFPDLEKLAAAYDIPYFRCDHHVDMESTIANALETPMCLVEIMLTVDQPFAPKMSSRRLTDGRMVSSPLEDMAPFLSRSELMDNMLIDLLPEE